MSSVFTPTRVRLTVEQFHDMGRAGILAPDERVELIEGELIEMAPIGSLHASVVSTLTTLFARHVGESAIVWAQNPLSLPPDTEPQPDIALLKPRADRYRHALPTAADVLLVIEVADTTLQYDRTIKLPLYANHGITEVWIVNLVESVVEIHREPGEGAYRVELGRTADDTAAPTALPGAEIALASILAT